MKLDFRKIFTRESMPHLAMFMLMGIFLLCCYLKPYNNQILSYQSGSNEKIVYLDPVDTAFNVEKISNFTPNIIENLPALEESLFFSQPKSNQYIDKQITKNNFTTQKTQLEREYVIEEGDTISQIAEKYDMHVATVYDRNGLSADNIEDLRPGDTIIVPAHDTSDSEQWLADLNDKKEQERQRLLALEKEQEKQRQVAAAEAARTVYTRSSATTTSNANYSGTNATTPNNTGSNGYPYGWCTYYVASQRNVPSSWGNAGQWLSSAQSNGYSTGSTPASGAIVVTGESWYGHVAVVNSVNSDGSINVSEMNYSGWGVVSSRTISSSSPVVKGYIY